MTEPVVTEADRKAAASVAVLVEMRELILSGKADHHAEPFARHREQAVREALEHIKGPEAWLSHWTTAGSYAPVALRERAMMPPPPSTFSRRNLMPSLSEQLKALEAEVTEGPWEACQPGDYGDFDGESRVVCGDDMRVAVFHWHPQLNTAENDANVELAVLLRNNLPRIIQALEAAEREEPAP